MMLLWSTQVYTFVTQSLYFFRDVNNANQQIFITELNYYGIELGIFLNPWFMVFCNKILRTELVLTFLPCLKNRVTDCSSNNTPGHHSSVQVGNVLTDTCIQELIEYPVDLVGRRSVSVPELYNLWLLSPSSGAFPTILHWLYNTLFAIRSVVPFFMALYRLSAVSMPVNCEKMWKRAYKYCILCSFVLPLLATSTMLLGSTLERSVNPTGQRVMSLLNNHYIKWVISGQHRTLYSHRHFDYNKSHFLRLYIVDSKIPSSQREKEPHQCQTGVPANLFYDAFVEHTGLHICHTGSLFLPGCEQRKSTNLPNGAKLLRY
uniref:Serpentine receptor class gamma n=1 Tax=Panagrellus redivivus TaxID=6233 RepID=A0A7E4UU16_PANRE